MRYISTTLVLFILLLGSDSTLLQAQHSVARQWNETVLEGIRKDFARPTVHARNLFHTSVAMYDAWAAYDDVARPYLLGNTVGNYTCQFNGVSAPVDIEAAREEAMSYAVFRIMKHRFANAPGIVFIDSLIHARMTAFGYDTSIASVDYANDGPAALGNYIAQEIIAYGFTDGANEDNVYENLYYQPLNQPLVMDSAGNPDIQYPNNWQPLTLAQFVDQSGNVIGNSTPDFLSPEWGNVVPFALKPWDRTTHVRDGDTYYVYLDPGPPPYLDSTSGAGISDPYKWTFALVSIWSAHLDTTDGVMWDISPGGIGNISVYPEEIVDHPNFYDLINGGENSPGHAVNPVTGQPYPPQMVPRGDYARVLAEFWADGPDSETPPGHWFTIVNEVNDHPMIERKWRGQGPVLNELEWDVKTYFTLGGAMHDAAIAAWSVKGWYDYIRPVSAIRFMADQGQSTDQGQPNYSPKGIPLVPGYIELVQAGDPLAGAQNEHVNKIKLYTWRGPDYITDPDTSQAGVGWILAEKWWPYQRPTFVTPPFAGFVSGHSTYSRTAAEVLTEITGDPFFPGGVGEFEAPMNQFLVFEEGPSTHVTLQWATYRDASDQCSLSRIWGGIHPPADDIFGRFMGMELGPEAVAHAEIYMGYPDQRQPEVIEVIPNYYLITEQDTGVASFSLTINYDEPMDTSLLPVVTFPVEDPMVNFLTYNATHTGWVDQKTYKVAYDVSGFIGSLDNIDVQVAGCEDTIGNLQEEYLHEDLYSINTNTSIVDSVHTNPAVITRADTGSLNFTITVEYGLNMDTMIRPTLSFPVEQADAKTLIYVDGASSWLSPSTFLAVYNVTDSTEFLTDIDVRIEGGQYQTIYTPIPHVERNVFNINMSEPQVLSITPDHPTVIVDDVNDGFSMTVLYNKAMNMNVKPQIRFLQENPLIYTLTYDAAASNWIDANRFKAQYNVTNAGEVLPDVDVTVTNGKDAVGNTQLTKTVANVFDIDMYAAAVVSIDNSVSTITDEQIGANGFKLSLDYDKPMNTLVKPVVSFPVEDPDMALQLNQAGSYWQTPTRFVAQYNVQEVELNLLNIDIAVAGAKDVVGNVQQPLSDKDNFSILLKGTGVTSLAKKAHTAQLYPNPAKGTVYIRLPEDIPQADLIIFDVTGTKLLEKPAANGDGVDLSDLPTGVYTYKLCIDDEIMHADQIIIE